jgi:16S rRNA (cytidine1402-2'-O)-methyltransferase
VSAPRPDGSGTLWLVATPIGNLGDLSPRAIDVLRDAKLVCCEDTRRTGRLLQHAGVRAERLTVVNEHTELARVGDVLDVLSDGGDVAVVTDAGTPGISDPGERMVRAVLDGGFEVSAVPGPAALVMALTISGLPTTRFVFEGFLPRAGRDRSDRLAALSTEKRTIVFYEAPHRIAKTIADLRNTFGDVRRVAVCRELTKLFESVARGTLGTIDIGEPRGEYVIVLDGLPAGESRIDDDTIRAELRAVLATGSSTRDAVDDVTRRLGASRNTVYALALGLA